MKQFIFRHAPLLLLAAAVLGVGCAEILGLEPPNEGPSTTGGSGGTTTGGTATGGTGGMTGHGGTAGVECLVDGDCPDDPASPCLQPYCNPNSNECAFTPVDEGTLVPCYTGPTGTLDVGACAAGLQGCDALGQPMGDCKSEVLPTIENCASPADEDCDGQGNDICGSGFEAHVFGGVGQNDVRAIQIDANGDLYLAGVFNTSAAIYNCTVDAATGGSLKGGYVVKLAYPNFNCAWIAHIEDAGGTAKLTGLAVGADTVWALGEATGAASFFENGSTTAIYSYDAGAQTDGILYGLDKAMGHKLLIGHLAGNSPVLAGGIAIDATRVYASFTIQGDVAMFTTANGNTQLPISQGIGGVTSTDIGVAAIDLFNNNAISWTQRYGSPSNDEAGALDVGVSNDVYIGGKVGLDPNSMAQPICLSHLDSNGRAFLFKAGTADGLASVGDGCGLINSTTTMDPTRAIWRAGMNVTFAGTAGGMVNLGCQVADAGISGGFLYTSKGKLNECAVAALQPGDTMVQMTAVTGIDTDVIGGGTFQGALFGIVSANNQKDAFVARYPGGEGPARWVLPIRSPGDDVLWAMAKSPKDQSIWVVGSCQGGMFNLGGMCDSSGDGFAVKITP